MSGDGRLAKRVTEGQRATITELRAQGLSVREIAAQVGLSTTTVSNVLKKAQQANNSHSDEVERAENSLAASSIDEAYLLQRIEELLDRRLGHIESSLNVLASALQTLSVSIRHETSATDSSRPREVPLRDQQMTCRECGRSFVWTAGEQRYYREKGFEPPVRCEECRKAKHAVFSPRSGHGNGGAYRDRSLWQGYRPIE